MLFLNKLLPVFVLPFGWVLLLLVFALWRKKRWPVVAALAVLVFFSLPVVASRLVGMLESAYPARRIAEAGPADAVVVLGGVLGPKTGPGYVTNWTEVSERFDAGLALLAAQQADWLVFTGARIPWEGRETLEGDDLKTLALQHGAPAERVLVTREVGNTWDEARAIAELAKQRGWRKVIVVTTAWHMPRAARLFRAAKVPFTPFPVDFRRDKSRVLSAAEFIPKAEAFQMSETALRECYGYAFYALTGR
ncbi:MAG: YdcF family protein [Opitutae bacterium]|nr:YdcF family protein [Opitutae bacterium]